MIEESILKKYGGQIVPVKKDNFIFMEGEEAFHYYQVKKGRIKMVNYNHEGKEFIQSIFTEDQSFGEPPLFGGFSYPASAQAMENSEIFKLNFSGFKKLLKDNFDIHFRLTSTLSNRLRYKSMILREISIYESSHRILTFIDYLKKESGKENENHEIDLTRQQLADLLGLRVETVIRSLKKLEEQNKITINGRKIFR